MSKTIEDTIDSDHQALFEKLELRYGSASAQAIIDQLEKVKSSGQTPDCLLVKALCDMKELFRGEAQEVAKALRDSRNKWKRHGQNVLPISQPVQEAEFRKIYRLYWISMKLFYPLYDQALTDARQPKFPMRISPQSSGTPLCRAFAA